MTHVEEINWRILDAQILDIKTELLRASKESGSFKSEHEAYAIMLEEFEELWVEIKTNGNRWKKRNEAIQLCAMILRYINDFANILGRDCGVQAKKGKDDKP